MQKYRVGLSIAVTMYANAFVEAESPEHAEQIALTQDKDGLIQWDREAWEYGSPKITEVEVNPD